MKNKSNSVKSDQHFYWPFLDLEFSPKRLLAGVVVMRANQLGVDLRKVKTMATSLLAPDVSEMLYPEGSRPAIASRVLSGKMLAKVEKEKANIIAVAPVWCELFDLPMRYMLLLGNAAISCSAPAYPQHIFLSKTAFATCAELREQILHEYCHNWLYLFQETGSLTRARSAARFVLPSGTGNRSVEEVFGAAHVAATLNLYYRKFAPAFTFVQNELHESRAQMLAKYLKGCVSILSELSESGSLTMEGESLFTSLKSTICESKI